MKIESCGALLNLPDKQGVYIIVCGYMGDTNHKLGEILYIGQSNSLRRRIAYGLASPDKSALHSIQKPLMYFQNKSGVANLLYAVIEDSHDVVALEHELLAEFKKRTGVLPAWNKTSGKKKSAGPALKKIAQDLLDKLSVVPEKGK